MTLILNHSFCILSVDPTYMSTHIHASKMWI